MTDHVKCTRCGGAHALSQCPWSDSLIEQVKKAMLFDFLGVADSAGLDLLLYRTAITQVSPEGVIRHVPIDEWMKERENIPFTG